AWERRGDAGGDVELSRRIAATTFAPPRCKIRSALTGAAVAEEIATPAWWMHVLREAAGGARDPERSAIAPQPPASKGPSTFHISMGGGSSPERGAATSTPASEAFARVVPSFSGDEWRRADLLDAVVRAHALGANVDWARVEGRVRRAAVSLPT